MVFIPGPVEFFLHPNIINGRKNMVIDLILDIGNELKFKQGY